MSPAKSTRARTSKSSCPRADAVADDIDDIYEDELTAGHGELVLVVDDEEGIREVVEATLIASGYRVLTAEDGEVASRFV